MPAEKIDVFWHPDALRHDPGRGVFGYPPSPLMAYDELHPENAERVRNMHAILQRGPIKDHLRWHDGRHATDAEILTYHDAGYFEEISKAAGEGERLFPGSTHLRPGTFEAALASAGTALAAMDHVLEGEGEIAYALVRPPGHHSARDQADGYCFFNQVGLCAELALASGRRRVVTIDWDVHHGNGTQEGFYDRDDVLTISLHMDHGGPWGPQHPQTGKADEVGRGAGVGYNLNVPLPMGTGDRGYEHAMEDIVIPAIDDFAPEAVIIASGQDANAFDINGRQCVTMAGFRRLGALARIIADRHAGGGLCLIQEGGYAISYAAFCLHGTLEGVLGLDLGLADPCDYYRLDPHHADPAITSIRAAHAAAIATGRA
jgi:acetoin utilization deacetylase AcuC-like enzyme